MTYTTADADEKAAGDPLDVARRAPVVPDIESPEPFATLAGAPAAPVPFFTPANTPPPPALTSRRLFRAKDSLELASDPKPLPKPPLTTTQWSLLGGGLALVLVYIVALVLGDKRGPGAWLPVLPTVCMVAGNVALIVGGVSDNWPAHVFFRIPARWPALNSTKWVLVRTRGMLILTVGAVFSFVPLALVEMFAVQILRVLLGR